MRRILTSLIKTQNSQGQLCIIFALQETYVLHLEDQLIKSAVQLHPWIQEAVMEANLVDLILRERQGILSKYSRK